MVTNIASNPNATITLAASEWRTITTAPSKPGTTYVVSVYLHVSGGSIKVAYNGHETISSDQRITFQMLMTGGSPMGMSYSVVSGNPTVTVTSMLICTLAEYQANRTLLDQLEWFDGGSMPLQ
jgi:hypothetical protein